MNRYILVLGLSAFLAGCATDASVYGPYLINQEKTLANAIANRTPRPVESVAAARPGTAVVDASPTARPGTAVVDASPTARRVVRASGRERQGPRRLPAANRSAW